MVCRMTWSTVKVKVMSAWKPLKRSQPSVPHRTNFWTCSVRTFGENWSSVLQAGVDAVRVNHWQVSKQSERNSKHPLDSWSSTWFCTLYAISLMPLLLQNNTAQNSSYNFLFYPPDKIADVNSIWSVLIVVYYNTDILHQNASRIVTAVNYITKTMTEM